MKVNELTMKNREIKFRGWFQQFDGKEFWVYGYFYKDEIGNSYITDGQTHWCIDEDSVFQYTGLKNPKGKEIYEGDIIDCIDRFNGSDFCGKVVFQDQLFAVQWKKGTSTITKPLFNGTSIKILGNIYENPELCQ